MTYHCPACKLRPTANLTLFEDVLYRPECIAKEVQRRHDERAKDTLRRLIEFGAVRQPDKFPPGGTKPPRPRRLTVVE